MQIYHQHTLGTSFFSWCSPWTLPSWHCTKRTTKPPPRISCPLKHSYGCDWIPFDILATSSPLARHASGAGAGAGGGQEDWKHRHLRRSAPHWAVGVQIPVVKKNVAPQVPCPFLHRRRGCWAARCGGQPCGRLGHEVRRRVRRWWNSDPVMEGPQCHLRFFLDSSPASLTNTCQLMCSLKLNPAILTLMRHYFPGPLPLKTSLQLRVTQVL